jgi:hypothetical protein
MICRAPQFVSILDTRLCVVWLATVLLVSAPTTLPAQENIAEDQFAFEQSNRSAEIFRFIRTQIPELERPLLALRRQNAEQFRQAMHSLEKSYQRLQEIKDSGNEGAYKRALEQWTLDASIKMTSAQLSIEDSPRLKRQLGRMLSRQYDSRLNYMISERDRLLARLELLDQSIESMEQNREPELERRMEAMLRTARRNREIRERPADPPSIIRTTNPATLPGSNPAQSQILEIIPQSKLSESGSKDKE